ncbi:MAG TPA: hypothetical protein VGN59_13845 [Acidimicrobiia bacterium]|jgi:hypothetical protein
MGPPLAAVRRAEEVFADPDVRELLLTWHAQKLPLLEMVDRLGFSQLVDPELRAAIEGLGPEEVAIIRAAVVEEIDRAGTSGSATLPVDCGIAKVTGPVSVTAADVDGRSVARVTPEQERSI